MLKSVVVGGLVVLALFLVPAGSAAPPGQVKASAIQRYVVNGVYTREQRSLLVSEGFDIGEASWADHVELYGTDAQARAFALRGLQVIPSMAVDGFRPGTRATTRTTRWSPTCRHSRRRTPRPCTCSRSGSRTRAGT